MLSSILAHTKHGTSFLVTIQLCKTPYFLKKKRVKNRKHYFKPQYFNCWFNHFINDITFMKTKLHNSIVIVHAMMLISGLLIIWKWCRYNLLMLLLVPLYSTVGTIEAAFVHRGLRWPEKDDMEPRGRISRYLQRQLKLFHWYHSGSERSDWISRDIDRRH